jgi:hypothetical protein
MKHAKEARQRGTPMLLPRPGSALAPQVGFAKLNQILPIKP